MTQFRLATFLVPDIHMITVLDSETLNISKTSKISKCSFLKLLYNSDIHDSCLSLKEKKERKNKQ